MTLFKMQVVAWNAKFRHEAQNMIFKKVQHPVSNIYDLYMGVAQNFFSKETKPWKQG